MVPERVGELQLARMVIVHPAVDRRYGLALVEEVQQVFTVVVWMSSNRGPSPARATDAFGPPVAPTTLPSGRGRRPARRGEYGWLVAG